MLFSIFLLIVNIMAWFDPCSRPT